MRSSALLVKQLNGVHRAYHEIIDDLTEDEWISQVLPGTNPLGFTLWHLPRTFDWAINTAVRGVPEVLAGAEWTGRGTLQTAGIGSGFSADEATQLVGGLTRSAVSAYADAVHLSIANWVSGLSDDDLDQIPDAGAHQAAFPEYQRRGFQEEVAGIIGTPIWRFLVAPCLNHGRQHLGELAVLKEYLRAQRTQAAADDFH